MLKEKWHPASNLWELHKKAHQKDEDYEEDWENEEIEKPEENEFDIISYKIGDKRWER